MIFKDKRRGKNYVKLLINREPPVKTTAQAWGRCAGQFQVLNVLCYIETMFLFTNKFVQMTNFFVF